MSSGLYSSLQAADRARRQDALDAEHLEPEDVRAEVQLGRQHPMPGAVPRQKRDALAAQRADDVRARRIAERRRDASLFAVGQLRHVVQATAADDANLYGCAHVLRSPVPRLALCRSCFRAMIARRDRRDRARRTPASRGRRFLADKRFFAASVSTGYRSKPMIHGRQVRRRRHQIGDEHRASVPPIRCRRSDDARCGRRSAHPHARHDRLVIVDQLQHAGLGERHEVVRQVAGAVALVRMRRVLPLAAADDVAGARERGRKRAGRVAHREAAGMIEVQVRGEHDVDVLEPMPGLRRQRDRGVVRAIDAVDLARTSRPSLSPTPASMSIVPHAAHEQRPHRQRDAVAIVGGRAFAAHSGFGTMPNIAPPSRRKKPSHSEISSRSPTGSDDADLRDRAADC